MKKPLSERFSKGLKQWLAVLPFLAVGMTLFIVFVLYPQIKNIYIALTNYSIMPGSENPFVEISLNILAKLLIPTNVFSEPGIML